MRMPDHSITGDGDATIFLLHGAYGSKLYWQSTTRRLVERGYRVVAWDAPGYGISPLPNGVSLPRLADAGAMLVAKTASRRNLLFGHSMGGQLAPRIFARVGGFLGAMVISSTIGYFGNTDPDEQKEFMEKRLTGVDSESAMQATTEQVVRSMFGSPPNSDECKMVVKVAAETPMTTFKAVMGAIKATQDSEAISAYSGLTVPTLLIAGERDQTGKVSGMKRLQALIPGADLEVISGAGHYGWAERPEVFMEILDRFLKKVQFDA